MWRHSLRQVLKGAAQCLTSAASHVASLHRAIAPASWLLRRIASPSAPSTASRRRRAQ